MIKRLLAASVMLALGTSAYAGELLRAADSSLEEAEAIYRLTALCTIDDRFVVPPSYGEHALEAEL